MPVDPSEATPPPNRSGDRAGWAQRLVAHRGHTRVCPENTLAAVRSAIEVGARHVEVDVQLSADGVPFLFHDRTLVRMCGVGGRLAQLRAAAVERLWASEPGRFGSRFSDEVVPRLEALVELLAEDAARPHLFVELKRAALEVFGAQRVLAAVLPVMAPLAGDWTLISFDLEVLQLARREAEVPLGPVLESFDQLQSATTLELEPDVIFCNQKRLPAAGPLEVQAPLVVYELDRAAPTRALIERGAALIETFAIGDLLAELSGH